MKCTRQNKNEVLFVNTFYASLCTEVKFGIKLLKKADWEKVSDGERKS
jgi:hypothetical protein